MLKPDFAFIEAMYEATSNKELDSFLKPVLRIMFAKKLIVGFLHTVLADEIDRTVQESTLFRTNSLATYVLSGFAQVVGGEYLKAVVIPILEDIANCPLDFEVNPAKASTEFTEEMQQSNLNNLVRACQRAYDSIASSLDYCPVYVKNAS